MNDGFFLDGETQGTEKETRLIGRETDLPARDVELLKAETLLCRLSQPEAQ